MNVKWQIDLIFPFYKHNCFGEMSRLSIWSAEICIFNARFGSRAEDREMRIRSGFGNFAGPEAEMTEKKMVYIDLIFHLLDLK